MVNLFNSFVASRNSVVDGLEDNRMLFKPECLHSIMIKCGSKHDDCRFHHIFEDAKAGDHRQVDIRISDQMIGPWPARTVSVTESVCPMTRMSDNAL